MFIRRIVTRRYRGNTCKRTSHVDKPSGCRSFRLQVVSPTSRFAYTDVDSPTWSELFRLHIYTSVSLPCDQHLVYLTIYRSIVAIYIASFSSLQKRAHWKTSPVKSGVPIRLCEQKRSFKDYRRFRSLMNFIAVIYSHTFKRQCINNRSRLSLF